ncbi:hypothetical protein P8452_05749 [Trifolium repens]|nr:hypothetical protein P8452_05749 [Trifolium repens]
MVKSHMNRTRRDFIYHKLKLKLKCKSPKSQILNQVRPSSSSILFVLQIRRPPFLRPPNSSNFFVLHVILLILPLNLRHQCSYSALSQTSFNSSHFFIDINISFPCSLFYGSKHAINIVVNCTVK